MIAVKTVRFVDDRQDVPGKGLTSSVTAGEIVKLDFDPVSQLLRIAHAKMGTRFVPAHRVMFFEPDLAKAEPAPAKK